MFNEEKNPPKLHEIFISVSVIIILVTPQIPDLIINVPKWFYGIPLVIIICIGYIKLTLNQQLIYKQKFSLELITYSGFSLLLFVYLAMTTSWTISTEQYKKDTILLTALSLIVMTLSISLSKKIIQLILFGLCLVSSLLGIAIIFLKIKYGTFVGVIYSSYLTPALLMGLGATGSNLQYLIARKKHKLYWFILSLISMIGLAFSLARGALLACLFSSLFLGICEFFVTNKYNKHKNALILFTKLKKILTLSTLVIISIILALQIERTRERLYRLFFENELEIGGRGDLWNSAWHSILDAPLKGYGLGASGLMSGSSDGGYPHNLVLQVWIDGGIFAAFVLLIILIMPFIIALLKHRFLVNKIAFLPLLGMYLFLILEFSKSHNFYVARPLFIIGICTIWILSKSKPKKM